MDRLRLGHFPPLGEPRHRRPSPPPPPPERGGQPPTPPRGPWDALLHPLEAVRRALERLAPQELVWGIFPGDGGFELLPAGSTRLDFERGEVASPKGTLPLTIPREVLARAQSAAFVADTLVYITLEPGFGVIPTAGAIIEGPARNVRRVVVESDVPYAFTMAAGTSLEAPRVRFDRLFQFRKSDTTLTKQNAAGTADTFSNLAFVPVTRAATGPKELDQDLYGVAYIRVPGWAQRVFVVRNLGTAAAEVQLFGAGSVQVATVVGWVADPDTGAAPVAVAAGAAAVLETGIPWSVMQLRGRVAAGEAAGAQARLLVEYAAVSGGVR